jgi:hypothetical protein
MTNHTSPEDTTIYATTDHLTEDYDATGWDHDKRLAAVEQAATELGYNLRHAYNNSPALAAMADEAEAAGDQTADLDRILTRADEIMAGAPDPRPWTIAISAPTQDWESAADLWAGGVYWGGFATEAEALEALDEAAADLIDRANAIDAELDGTVITWADGMQTVLGATQVDGDMLDVSGERIAELASQ